MDYKIKIQELCAEAKKAIQFKRMSTGARVITIIAMIPVSLISVCLIAYYYALLFLYNAFLSPTDYLESWLDSKKENIQHLTQAVLYFVCMPFIFFCRVIMSFFGIIFYVLWFMIMCSVYLSTLGGIRWQPSLNLAVYDSSAEYELYPGEIGSILYTIFSFAFLALYIIVAFLHTVTYQWQLYQMANTFRSIYVILVVIVNPILFRKKEIVHKNEEI